MTSQNDTTAALVVTCSIFYRNGVAARPDLTSQPRRKYVEVLHVKDVAETTSQRRTVHRRSNVAFLVKIASYRCLPNSDVENE